MFLRPLLRKQVWADDMLASKNFLLFDDAVDSLFQDVERNMTGCRLQPEKVERFPHFFCLQAAEPGKLHPVITEVRHLLQHPLKSFSLSLRKVNICTATGIFVI